MEGLNNNNVLFIRECSIQSDKMTYNQMTGPTNLTNKNIEK